MPAGLNPAAISTAPALARAAAFFRPARRVPRARPTGAAPWR
eukprot:COSAG06_NODE_43256_length_373_cov_2.894161_1_plen_41_part_10